MSEPFRPPAPDPITARVFVPIDIADALLTAVYGLAQNLVVWVAALIVFTMIYVLSFCTCVGFIFVIPPMMWAFYAMAVETVRGETQITTVLAGTKNFLVAFRRMWGWMLINTMLVLPGFVLIFAGFIGYFGLEGLVEASQDPKANIAITSTTMAASVVYIALFARIQLVPILIVDRGLPVLTAYAESWRLTEGNWLRLIGLLYFITLWTLPASTIQMGMQYYVATLPPMDQLAMLFPQMGVSLVVSFWSIALGMVNICAMTAAYDQLIAHTEPTA